MQRVTAQLLIVLAALTALAGVAAIILPQLD
jgi:hypothetical protein